MRQLVLLDGVGWSVTNNRCEIFVTSLEETFLKRAEDFACKVVETLPHTPWGSVGVNLQFLALDDATDIVDRYTTVENFEAEFQVGNQAQSTEILISPAVTLNVQRNIEDQFSVYFNHHYHSVDPLTVREKLQGSISQALERCRAVMSKFYQMTEEQVKVLDPQVGEVSSGQ